MELISVKSDSAPHGHIRIQWNMGNSCNYECEYCPAILHNGSRPWYPLDKYKIAAQKITEYYKEQSVNVYWELIGGEVTVMPGFGELLEHMHNLGAGLTVYTNGSRTINWWKKHKHYIDHVQYTYHVMTQDKEHFLSVLNEINDTCSFSIQLAGAKDHLETLLSIRQEVVDRYQQPQNISIKRLYKKTLNGYNPQESFYDYTEREQEILSMTFQSYDNNTQEIVDVKYPQTIFKYKDGTEETCKTSDVKNLRKNSFTGMKCKLGTTGLNIDFNGDIWGSWCGAKRLGNVSELDSVNFVLDPVECGFNYCNNENDIVIEKFR